MRSYLAQGSSSPMGGIKLSLNRRKLILDTTTKVLNHSFNQLTVGRKRRFVKHFQNSSTDISFKDLKLERKLWDIERKGEERFDRIIVRLELANRRLNRPRIFAKAGLTREIGNNKDYGLVMSYGWHSEFREPGFERNVVGEMNQATNGVKVYHSTPGEKTAVAKLTTPAVMKSYLDS